MSEQGWSAPGAHPVSRCLDLLEAALDQVAEVDPAFMTTADKRAELLRITKVENKGRHNRRVRFALA